MKLWRLIPMVVLALLLAPAHHASVAQSDSGGDKLIYFVSDSYSLYKGEPVNLMMYDIENGETTPLNIMGEWRSFRFSIDGRLAFSHDGMFYILDTQVANSVPVPVAVGSPRAWSPDGHYLAFDSGGVGERQLYIWDGKQSLRSLDYI